MLVVIVFLLLDDILLRLQTYCCVLPFWILSAKIGVLGIISLQFEEATPFTLFALPTLFALLARPTPECDP